jgi:hypothetical protein
MSHSASGSRSTTCAGRMSGFEVAAGSLRHFSCLLLKFSHISRCSTSPLIHSQLFPPILQPANENFIKHCPTSVHAPMLDPPFVSLIQVIPPFKPIPGSYYAQFSYSTLWVQIYLHKIFYSQFWSSKQRSAIHGSHHDSSHNYCDFYNNYFWKNIANAFIRLLVDFIDVNLA